MSSVSEQAELAPSDADTVDDLRWADLEIRKAQRQIVRGLAELAEGIVSLSLMLLEVRRRRLYRFDEIYPTFERFVEGRYGISAQQATMYVDALLNLGATQYRALLADVGLQRTYALSLLHQSDPALVDAFQRLPDDERQAVTTTDLVAVDASVTAQLQRRVADLEREITREEGLLSQTRHRLQEVEELHQRVTGTLIDERDSARMALDQEQSQTERLRALLQEARRQQAESKPSSSEPEATTVLLVTCDVATLVSDICHLADKLERLTGLAPGDLATDQRRDLTGALQQLDHLVHDLLDS
ncbi:MAG TPA: hypothetical protein VFT99_06015 [Roseiflexaceae bacterium]|nr:hypothetical protein [Roseiflexaceae bacterium]